MDYSAGSSQQPMDVELSTPSDSQNDDKFVWPWLGIVVNFPTEYKNGKYVGESGNRLKEQLLKFNVLKVHPLYNHDGHSGNCIINFSKDWSGFKDAMAFESHFKVDHYGKRDWQGRGHLDSHIYGWVARDDDYNSDGLIGEYLKKHGDLKTVIDVANEESWKADRLIAYLATKIEEKNKLLYELECKYNMQEAAFQKILQVEKQLDAKQKLELEIQQLQEKLQALKHGQ